VQKKVEFVMRQDYDLESCAAKQRDLVTACHFAMKKLIHQFF
jgi:hypothetical protein